MDKRLFRQIAPQLWKKLLSHLRLGADCGNINAETIKEELIL